jgi:hypothetical protein
MCSYCDLQNSWESSNGFQRIFVPVYYWKIVENRCSIPNYFAIPSTEPSTDPITTAHIVGGEIIKAKARAQRHTTRTAILIIIEGPFQVFQRISSSKLVLRTVEKPETDPQLL